MDGSLPYLPRIADATLAQACTQAPIVILDGPRAAGKTTSALQIAAATVSLPHDLAAISSDADGYLSSLPSPTLIDEWQLGGVDLLWTLKQIVDRNPTPGQFILTGSVEPASYGPTYPLTGRSISLHMRPMTKGELTGHGDQPTWLSRRLSTPRDRTSLHPHTTGTDFDISWLTQSGFPGMRFSTDVGTFLEAYATSVAQRAGAEGRDAFRLLNSMRVLATLESQAVPDQRIWDAADINKATWKHYDDVLSRTFVASPCQAYSTNRLKRLTSYPKRFLADCALAVQLADLDETALKGDPKLAGQYFESYTMQQLRPQVDAVGGHLQHLRTGSGAKEIDAIVEVRSRVFAVECKLSQRPTIGDAKHLVWLRDQLGDKFIEGHVVHTGNATYQLDEHIWATPLAAVASV